MKNAHIEYLCNLQAELVQGGALAIEDFSNLLKNNNKAAEQFAHHIESVLNNASYIDFLVDTGIPQNKGFLTEAITCIRNKFVPAPRDESHISDVVATVFPTVSTAYWLAKLPVSFVDAVVFTIEEFSISRSKIWDPVKKSLFEALEILSSRIFVVSCNPELVCYLDEAPYKKSIFYKLKLTMQELVYFLESEQSDKIRQHLPTCLEQITEAKKSLEKIIARMEKRGVSVEVVFMVDMISRSLNRIFMLLNIIDKAQATKARYAGFIFVAGLVNESIQQRRLSKLFSNNLGLLTKKITEHASRTGEHYITSSSGEYKSHFLRSLGAGVITAVTTLIKFAIGKAKLAPLFETSLSTLNYVSSFLFLQMVGFTLATKQPSMTAASLADALAKNDANSLSTLVARIFRSQFVSVMGNVMAVIPSAVFINAIYFSVFGSHILNTEKATYVLQTLDALSPATYIMAILTGCLLWLSSLVGGWLENWVIYTRLSDAIREHRLASIFGKRLMHRVANIIDKQTLGFGSNTSLGVLLAMPSLVGRFIGLPMDVRHVTLGSGSLALACVPLLIANDPLAPHLILRAVIGICFIGILNVFVSFALAFVVALRSRDLSFPSSMRAVKWIVVRALKQPRDFFIPPRHAPNHQHHHNGEGHR